MISSILHLMAFMALRGPLPSSKFLLSNILPQCGREIPSVIRSQETVSAFGEATLLHMERTTCQKSQGPQSKSPQKLNPANNHVSTETDSSLVQPSDGSPTLANTLNAAL